MQKLYWLICGIKFKFLQNYNIGKLLNICHDYPEPVDKHYGNKNFTQSPAPEVGSNVK